jgi:hypothetical protein
MARRRRPRGDEIELRFGLRIDEDGTATVIDADEVPAGSPEVTMDLADMEDGLGLHVDGDTAQVVPVASVPPGSPEVTVDLGDVDISIGPDLARALDRDTRRRSGGGFVYGVGAPVLGAAIAGLPGFLIGLVLGRKVLRERRR